MNDRVSAAIFLNKKDAETKENKAQGDASLENAVYGLYARKTLPIEMERQALFIKPEARLVR